jgi:chaperonin cofactor prefoldin
MAQVWCSPRYLPHVQLVVLALCLFNAMPVLAIETAPRISDREVIEALVDLKAGQHRLDQRIDQLEKRMDQRFESMERQMNQRFDDIKWFLGIMIGTLLVINTGVLGYVLKRQGTLEQSIETIKDELAFLKSVIEKLLPPRQGHL